MTYQLPAKQTLGMIYDLDETHYHSSPGISKHGLDLLNVSPAHYKAHKTEETKALIYGGALHAMVLEPHKFDNRYVINDKFKDFRTKLAREWKAELEQDNKRIISIEEHEHMKNIVKAIREHDHASIYLNPEFGKAEISAYWIDNNFKIWDDEKPTYRLCRCRPDFYNEIHHVIVDLKTTVSAGETDFAKQCANFRYHVQDVFYTDGLRQCGVKVNKFVFVAVEKEPPYAIGIYSINPEGRRIGRIQYQRNLRRYNECMDKGEWPSYPPQLREISLPKWAEFSNIY